MKARVSVQPGGRGMSISEPLGISSIHPQLLPDWLPGAPSDDFPLILQVLRVGGDCLAVLLGTV